MTWQRDNWGWRARIGAMIVGDDHVPEPEWWAMAPEGVSIHMARVAGGGFRVLDTGSAKPGPYDQLSDCERAAHLFGQMALDVVCLAHSSSSFIGGKGWDEAAVEQLRQFTGDTLVTTNGLDCLAALKAVGAQRPFLVLPPWYNDNVINGGLRYLADWGVELAAHRRFDPGRGWNHLAPNETYRDGLNHAQQLHVLFHDIKRHCPANADAVLIVGTGFRAVGVVQPLEQDLGVPVITANQASLWHCLKLARVGAPVTGYGRLFATS